jgi:hypothetical protein
MHNDALFSEKSEPEKITMTEDVDDEEVSEFPNRYFSPLGGRGEFWISTAVPMKEGPFLTASVEMRLKQKRAAATLYYKNLTLGNILRRRLIDPTIEGWFSHPWGMAEDPRKDDEAMLRKKLLECFRSLVDISTAKESKGPAVENEKSRLEKEIAFLKDQLQSTNLAVRIYNIGAVGFLGAVFSLLVWSFTGVGAPLHPTFAILLVPVSLGLFVMAFLTRRDQETENIKSQKRT